MGSSQEPTFSSASTAAQVNASALDLLPVYAKELIAGGAAGAFAKTAVAPLERVKILLQTRTEGFQSLGILQSLRKLWQYEGIRGFYKGNGASVLRIVPYAALHYMTYEQYRCWILNNFAPSVGTGPVVDLLAGSAAGGTAVLCTYPLDLARTKLAYQVSNVAQPGNALGNSGRQPTYSGIKDVFKTVYKEGGARSLYRGVGLLSRRLVDKSVEHERLGPATRLARFLSHRRRPSSPSAAAPSRRRPSSPSAGAEAPRSPTAEVEATWIRSRGGGGELDVAGGELPLPVAVAVAVALLFSTAPSPRRPPLLPLPAAA